MEEQWKAIAGKEGYEVSNHGRVRSYWKRVVRRLPGGNRAGFENQIVLAETAVKIMKPYALAFGHLYINFKGKKELIQRLVAIAFLPNPDNKPEVDHIDRNPANNHVSNLRWATRTEQSLNTRARTDSASGIKGIRYRQDKNSWQAYWRENGKSKFKDFKTKEEAIAHRKQMTEQHYDRQYYTERI